MPPVFTPFMRQGYSARMMLLACSAVCLVACSPDEEKAGKPACPPRVEVHEQPAAAKGDKPNAALISCAAHGNAAGAAQALQDGADMEARDENGLTPLMWAAQQMNSAVVALLLERGANPRESFQLLRRGGVDVHERSLGLCGGTGETA